MTSHTQRYERLLKWIHSYNEFNSEEQAQVELSKHCSQGEIVHFVVRRDNAYDMYRGYWNREQFASQLDFTISLNTLDTARRAAAVELGEQELQKLQLNH